MIEGFRTLLKWTVSVEHNYSCYNPLWNPHELSSYLGRQKNTTYILLFAYFKCYFAVDSPLCISTTCDFAFLYRWTARTHELSIWGSNCGKQVFLLDMVITNYYINYYFLWFVDQFTMVGRLLFGILAALMLFSKSDPWLCDSTSKNQLTVDRIYLRTSPSRLHFRDSSHPLATPVEAAYPSFWSQHFWCSMLMLNFWQVVPS